MYTPIEYRKLAKANKVTHSSSYSSSSSSSSSSSYNLAAGRGASAHDAVQISPQKVSLKLRISKYNIILLMC